MATDGAQPVRSAPFLLSQGRVSIAALSADPHNWAVVLSAFGTLATLVAALVLWRRHRHLCSKYDRQRERERRAYWGFE